MEINEEVAKQAAEELLQCSHGYESVEMLIYAQSVRGMKGLQCSHGYESVEIWHGTDSK